MAIRVDTLSRSVLYLSIRFSGDNCPGIAPPMCILAEIWADIANTIRYWSVDLWRYCPFDTYWRQLQGTYWWCNTALALVLWYVLFSPMHLTYGVVRLVISSDISSCMANSFQPFLSKVKPRTHSWRPPLAKQRLELERINPSALSILLDFSIHGRL